MFSTLTGFTANLENRALSGHYRGIIMQFRRMACFTELSGNYQGIIRELSGNFVAFSDNSVTDEYVLM